MSPKKRIMLIKNELCTRKQKKSTTAGQALRATALKKGSRKREKGR
jgi:hypothetical protein